jgi:hypothetical protein
MITPINKSNPTLQEAQELIVHTLAFIDNFPPGSLDVRELLNVFDESGFKIVPMSENDNLAKFALQILDRPLDKEFDSNFEALI